VRKWIWERRSRIVVQPKERKKGTCVIGELPGDGNIN
jgi:hypothetical protein